MPGTDIDTMPTRRAVDNTDWLKTIAIILVSVDHFGYFFIEDNQWWDVIGRLAAPVFFYLLGYAQTRKVPVSWLWLALMLTIMDSWNNDWTWVAPNILFSLALIRLARPYVQILLQRYGWVAFVLLVSTLFAMLPITADVVEYGSEGWMWALFGLCQRRYVDTRPLPGASQKPTAQKTNRNPGLMRLLACLIATGVCIWQEQLEYSFSEIQFAALVFGMGMLSIGLCLFLRGPSRFQPPSPLAIGLRYIGRHTLEIYAIQLAGFEIIINLLPDLAA
jgi:hypothetical protein